MYYLFVLFFLEYEILTTNGIGIGSWHYSFKPSQEDGPRCHVWHQWFHVVPPYHMTCYQCKDVYSTVVYYGSVPLGAVYLRDCDSWRTRDAVSIMYPDVGSGEDHKETLPPLVHTVQYNILGGKCARMKYRRVMGDRWLPLVSRCDDITHWDSRIGKGFVNGWKTQPFSGKHGVVKTPLKISKGLEQNCRLIRNLPHRNMLYSLECFDCNNPLLDGYLAIVYLRGVPMAAASVGTCRTPVLEKSISMVQTGGHLEVGVQYLLGKDSCVTRSYRMVNGGVEEGDDIKCSDTQQSILTRREKIMATFGYVNGWRPKLDYDIIRLVDTPSIVTSLGTTSPTPAPPIPSPPQTLTVFLDVKDNVMPVQVFTSPNVAQTSHPPHELPPPPKKLPSSPKKLPPPPQKLPSSLQELPPPPQKLPTASQELSPPSPKIPPPPQKRPPSNPKLTLSPDKQTLKPQELPPSQILPPPPQKLPPKPEKLPPPPLETELVKVGEGLVEVAKMPGDGHCLFTSLLHQLKLSNPGDSGHIYSVHQLRRQVVLYVKNQLKKSNALWKEQLVDSVEADPNRYPNVDENGNTIPVDKRIEAFLNNLEDKEWGGTETIVAVSHLYNVVIVTYFESSQDKHGKIVTYPERKSDKEIAVVYRLGLSRGRDARIERIHYDSFIRFVTQS